MTGQDKTFDARQMYSLNKLKMVEKKEKNNKTPNQRTFDGHIFIVSKNCCFYNIIYQYCRLDQLNIHRGFVFAFGMGFDLKHHHLND